MNNKTTSIKDPKLYFCENCELNFSSIEDNGYKVICPYCHKHLNTEILDSYYSTVSIPTEI